MSCITHKYPDACQFLDFILSKQHTVQSGLSTRFLALYLHFPKPKVEAVTLYGVVSNADVKINLSFLNLYCLEPQVTEMIESVACCCMVGCTILRCRADWQPVVSKYRGYRQAGILKILGRIVVRGLGF